MATYTTNIRLEKQASGANSGTWGDRLNENVIDMVDQAVGSYTTISLGASSHTLTTNDGTADEARSSVLYLTGTLTSSVDVITPTGVEKTYIVENNTSGAYTVTLKTVGGGGVTVPQGTTMTIISDGVSVGVGSVAVTPAGNLENITLTSGTIVGSVLTTCAVSSGTINAATITGGTVSAAGLTACSINGGTVSTTTFTADGQAALNAKVSVSGAAVGNVVSSSDSGAVTLDLATSNYFIVTMTGNVTVANPSNPVKGQSGLIYLIQDGTGSRTAAWGSSWNFPSGTTVSCTPSIGAVDLFSFFVRGTSDIDIAGTRDLKTG